MENRGYRPVDHLVLPVNDLKEARARYAALGFTVAELATHPFGTSNACVFFADKTYLEPLAITHPDLYQNALAQNAFIAHDQAFRTQQTEGLSAIVALSDDAPLDDKAYHQAGISAGDMVEFARQMRLPDGRETEAAFRLAFAKRDMSDPLLLFSCERIKALSADRKALETHANSVTGLKRIELGAAQPEAYIDIFTSVFGEKPIITSDGLVFQTDNIPILLLRNEALAQIAVLSVVFAVADREMTMRTLADKGVRYVKRLDRSLGVKPHPGQGVTFVFEEND